MIVYIGRPSGHDPKGGLLSTRYAARNQQCVDRAAAEAITATQGLPLAALNWRETFQRGQRYRPPISADAEPRDALMQSGGSPRKR